MKVQLSTRVLLGNADRATNTFHYSGLQTSGGVQYVNCVM